MAPQEISPTTVIVVGAGIAGLMCALECSRQGYQVRVLERTPHHITAGDSFSIGPTALEAIRKWPDMAKHSDEIAYYPRVVFCDISGTWLSDPVSLEDMISHNGQEGAVKQAVVRHSRPKFAAMLLEQLKATDVNVEYGCDVKEYLERTERSKAAVKLKDDTVLEADLVVAADGIHGNSWKLVQGERVPARSSGTCFFRVAYPVGIAMADPIVAERFALPPDGHSIAELWRGPGMTASFWRSADEMTIAISHPDTGTAEESWSHRVSPEEILRYTSTIPGWPKVADRLIETIPPEKLVDFRVMWRDPQPIWTSPSGRVVQIGDAAHTFLPSSGNGGTQAIEDAVSLAMCLSMAGDKTKIPDATKVHNLLRFERVSCLQAFGVVNREKQQTEEKKRMDKPMITLPKWVTEHDPEEYARMNYGQALANLQFGNPFSNTNIPPGMEYRSWTIDGLLAAHARGEPTVLDGDWN